MTLAVVPFALVSTYRSTGVLSAVLPKSNFWMPGSILPAPFACGSAAMPGEHIAQTTAIMTPPHIADVRMVRLLVSSLPNRTFHLQSREKASPEPLSGSFPADQCWFWPLGQTGAQRR